MRNVTWTDGQDFCQKGLYFLPIPQILYPILLKSIVHPSQSVALTQQIQQLW